VSALSVAAGGDLLAELQASVASCQKGKALSADEVVKKFVSTDLVSLALLDKKPVEIVIGTYTSRMVVSTCTNGNCGAYAEQPYKWVVVFLMSWVVFLG